MVTRTRITDVVAAQLPEFIRAEYPTFVAFVEAYYEFLQSNYVDIQSLRDIDETLDEFIKYFKAELAHNYPISSSYDTERYLLKHIKDQYLAKGSEASYKLLFRLLYGKDVYMDYPGKQMLRVSDGKWQQDVSIFVRIDLGDPFDLIGKTVSIQTSKKISRDPVTAKAIQISTVTANIENVLHVKDNVYEFYLDRNFYGEILPFDVIKFKTEFQGQILPCTTDVIVKHAGVQFRPGMVFKITAGESTAFWFKVIKTDENGGLVNVDLIRFGLNYSTDFSVTLLPTSAVTTRKRVASSPIVISYAVEAGVLSSVYIHDGGSMYQQVPDIVIGGNGSGATAHAVLTNGSISDIIIDTPGMGYTTIFVNVIPKPGDIGSGALVEGFLGSNYIYNFDDETNGFTENGYLNLGDYWDVTESGRGATATAIVNDGVITKINVTQGGQNYTTSTVTITDSTGSGTTAVPVIKNGVITGINIVQFGFNYTNPTVTINGNGSGATAVAVVKDGGVTGVTITNQGSYYNYNLPTVDICTPQDSDGKNIVGGVTALAKPTISGGKVVSVKITKPGSGYLKDHPPQVVIRGSSGYADGAYVGTVVRQYFLDAKDTIKENPALLDVKLGAVARYPGYYKTNDGFLDDSIFIQDSYYYQTFSYVIRIDEQLEKYASVVRTMLHPSGMALFGEYSINNSINLNIALTSLIKSLGVTLYDDAIVEDMVPLIMLFKDVSDAVVAPGESSSLIDSITAKYFGKPLNDSFVMTEPFTTKKTTKAFTHSISTTDFETRVFTKSILTSQSIADLTTKAITKSFTNSQPLSDTTNVLFGLNILNESIPSATEDGYLHGEPYDQGGYFAEEYNAGRLRNFSS